MESLVWKLRVATLWILLGVGQLAAILAAFLVPDVLGELVDTGEFEGGKIDGTFLTFFMLVFTLIPLAMAFLTLALRDPISRWLNAILGGLFAVSWALDAAQHLGEEEVSSVIVICGTLAVAGLLIVWHAWRWPRPAEQDLADRRPVASPDQRAAKPV